MFFKIFAFFVLRLRSGLSEPIRRQVQDMLFTMPDLNHHLDNVF